MRSLEISYRKGKPYAGYIYLGDRPLPSDARVTTESLDFTGIVLDFINDDELVGIEILAFNEEVISEIETVLKGEDITFEASDLAPILRARN